MHRYPDGRLAVFYGPRKLAEYEPYGSIVSESAPASVRPRERAGVAR